MKRTAILVVNPVNGAGLFSYLEALYENGIPFKTFSVAPTTSVRTNSGVAIETDDVVANLRAEEFDALIFACGDAMPHFGEHAAEPWNRQMLAAIGQFDAAGKILAGHCAAALLYDAVGAGCGRRVALHPMIKNVVKNVVATDEKMVVDGNIFTAQTEHAIPELLPELIGALK